MQGPEVVSQLEPAEYNPRKISEKDLRELSESLAEFGDLSGIVFNVRTGRLVGGHQRMKHVDPSLAVRKIEHRDKWGTVALGFIDTEEFGRMVYREVDWEETKELAANIAANKHGGAWDFPKLKEILLELDQRNYKIELTGYDQDELKEIFDWEPGGKEGEGSAIRDGKKLETVVCPECDHEFQP